MERKINYRNENAVSYKVLIVDDSSFFQIRLKSIIEEHEELQVIGIAENGQQAVDMEEQLRPDIITMDYEMPYLDGVSAVKQIMAKRQVPIVMFSSMTYEGAKITLDALAAGAVDFIPKNFAEVSRHSVFLKKKLHEKLLLFVQKKKPYREDVPSDDAAYSPPELRTLRNEKPASVFKKKTLPLKGRIRLIVIGASTGGPVAITQILTKLKSDFPSPIIVIQHMPQNFTRAFAERLNRQCALSIKEAELGDRLQPGVVLVAPGARQLLIDQEGKMVKVIKGDDRANYKPSLDITFASAANVFGGDVLGIVLTGMGADGCEGARLLKARGSSIWSQDSETSVVYGMPAAVANAGLVDEVLPLEEIAKHLEAAL